MTATSTLPLRPNTATAGICWDHRLVLGAFGAPKMRQRYGLQIRDRLPNSRQPIISRAARDAGKCGYEIGGSEARKLFSECHHADSTIQRKIRNAENKACKSPQCGHNGSMANIPMHKIQTDKYGAFETAYRASNGKLYLPKTTGRIIVDGPFGRGAFGGTIQVIGGKEYVSENCYSKQWKPLDAVLSKLTKAGKNPEIESTQNDQTVPTAGLNTTDS